MASALLASALRPFMSAQKAKEMGDGPNEVEGNTDPDTDHWPTRLVVLRAWSKALRPDDGINLMLGKLLLMVLASALLISPFALFMRMRKPKR